MATETVKVDATNGFTATDLSFAVNTASPDWIVQVVISSAETFGLNQTATWTATTVEVIKNSTDFTHVMGSVLIGNSSITDFIQIVDNVKVPHFETILQALNLAETNYYDPSYIVAIVDNLILNAAADTRIIGLTLISEIIHLTEALINKFGASIFDTVDIQANFINNIKVLNTLIDNLILTEATSYTGGIFITLSQTINLPDNISLKQILNSFMQEVIYFGGVLELDGEAYTFVLNTETEAISTYTNYKFNSISGNLAANETGIYELTGSTDVGASIPASFLTGLMDFGSSIHKQVPIAYLGLSSNGTIVFKTITDSYGVRKERWYKLITQRTATDTARVKLGKGVKSKYWQFEIINTNGADFDIKSLELLPLLLKRRI